MSEQIMQSFNGKAGADLSSNQNRFVYQSAAKTYLLCATAGMKADAVLQDEPDAAGVGCKLADSGIVFVEGGAVVAAGADVSNDTVGRGITALPGYHVHGKAFTACGGDGEYFAVKLSLAGVLAYGLEYALETPVQTAAFTAAVNSTWEDVDVVALLNAALANNLPTTSRIRMTCVLEIADGAGAAETVKIANGGTPDNDDTVVSISTAGLVASEYHDFELITDALGQIKFETSSIANITGILHLKSFSFIHPTVWS